MAHSYTKGEFVPKNQSKYVGKVPIIYRSSYEKEFLEWADRSPSVLEYGLESVVVKYYNPIKQRPARYIVDVYLKYRNRNGEIKEELIEIKPIQQVRPPTKGKKKKKSTLVREAATWHVNQAKWRAAMKYADERGWTFRILTENSIFKG